MGKYASMNCTPYTGDDSECVHRNQARLRSLLPVQDTELVIPYQTHGTTSRVIDKTFLTSSSEERQMLLQGIDALLTDLHNVCLCISTADCIPLLLYDARHQAIAAVHAGWRGTVQRIVRNTLWQMHELYHTNGSDVYAIIGPGISLDAFEVGDEVYEAFRNEGFPMSRIAYRQPETHKYHIDLPAANQLQLQDFGIPVRQIQNSGICTYTRYEDFFSARRLGIQSGRILTGITLLN